ncbi:MAG: hypothetical protein U0573_11535 [Phycisphaerales bacterium]|nr:hypothetical protein [Planctomycetota bacterium]
MRISLIGLALTAGVLAGTPATFAQVGAPTQVKASDAAANRFFGYSTAIDGDTMVTGAPLATGGGISNNDGNVYVFRWNGTTWVQEQRILGPSAVTGSQTDFGRALAISGNTIAVGARLDDTPAGNNAGSVYVYTRVAGVWTLQQRLTASNGAADDNFGDAVAIDGDTIAVAAPNADPSGNTSQGSLYAFTRAGTTWTEQQILPAMTGAAAGDKVGENGALSIFNDSIAAGAPAKGGNSGRVALYKRQLTSWTVDAVLSSPLADATGQFGSSVSLVGDRLAVGAKNSSLTVGTGGAAWVFTRTSGTWSTAGTQLVPTGLAAGDNLGFSIALGTDTVLIGSPGRSTNTGAAYAFVYANGAWTQQAQILAPDAATGDFFGWAVAISGNVGVFGAEGDDLTNPTLTDAGSVWIIGRDGSNWLHGDLQVNAATPAVNENFGVSTDIDGSYAVFGAMGYQGGAGANEGAAYVFQLQGSQWTQQQRLVPSAPFAGAKFGRGISISGNTIVGGAPNRTVSFANQGAGYVFVRNGSTWSQQAVLIASDGAAGDNFGVSTAIDGDTAVVGAYLDDSGALTDCGGAYIYTRSAGVWTQIMRIGASDAAANDYFGFSVAISGNNIVVGAYNKNSGTGAAYVFLREGPGFKQVAKLVASDAATGTNFGTSVAIDKNLIVVGCPKTSGGGFGNSGGAYVFTNPQGNTWQQVAKLNALDAQQLDNFGNSVDISGTNIAVGANLDDLSTATDAGAVYVFTSISQLPQGPWVQVAKDVRSAPATNDWLGYSVSISGANVMAGAFKANPGAAAGGGLGIFGDVSDSLYNVNANMSTGSQAQNLQQAIASASGGQTVVGSAGAFGQAADINFAGKALSVVSRSSLALPVTSQVVLNDGATLAANDGYGMSLYGPVRTANDSGRSSVEADWIRTGGASSVAIGKHELSFDAFATELGGRTTLQNKESVLSSSGALAFSGVLNDVFGGTINAGGNLVFDGIANLSGTSISAGGPVYINTISSLSNVMLGSAGVNIAGGGAFIGSGKILGAVNSSGKIIPSDPLVIIGSLVSNSGATINLTGSTLNVFGAVTDNGTTTGTIGGCPNCIGLQPALYTIQNGYTLGESGSLALGGVMQIGGSFDSFLTDSSRFQMLGGTIRFAAAGSSSFEAMSHDFGPAGAAMRGTVDGSFPLMSLEITAPTTLNLIDARDNDLAGQSAREALYLDSLYVAAGSRLNTNGIRVYAHSWQIDGTIDNVANIVHLGGPCDADLYIDAVVDDADFSIFLSAYNLQDCSDNSMPRGCPADLNHDGFVDDADFTPFVIAYDKLVCD